MAATLQFSESNTSGESVRDNIANINFGNIDNYEIVPASNPINAGENSFEKYIRLKFGGTGWIEISNVKLWKSSGDYVTGETIKAAANQTFDTPSASTSSKAISNIPTTLGTALSIQSTEVDPTKFTTPGYSKYIVLQTQTTISTPSGAGNQKVITVQYNET